MSPLKWTSKSTRTIALELSRLGHPVSSVTVGRCLEDMGYTLQANVKTREGARHPDRDAQFRYLNRQVKSFRRDGSPVISVDTKKKELVGAFKNAGGRELTIRPSSPWRAFGAGGAWTGNDTIGERKDCSSAPTAEAATGTANAPGNFTCRHSVTKRAWLSQSAITRLAQANGTRSNTGSSLSSV
jgi:hypothetical protein